MCGWTSSRTSIVTPRAGSTRRFDHPSKALRADIQDHLAAPKEPAAPARPSMLDEITIRMCGDNVTLMRVAWLELLESMRDDSTLAARIRERLAPIPTAWKHNANDRIACELGDHRACTHDPR